MPWINKASLALYITCIIVKGLACVRLQRDQPEVLLVELHNYVFLAYVMPWINKASLALYITCIIVKGLACVRLQRDQPEVRKVYCTVEFVSVIEASKLLVAIEVEVSLRLHLHDFWHQYQCVHILLMTLCSYWGYGQVFITCKR